MSASPDPHLAGAYDRLARLPLTIEAYASEPAELEVSSGFRRVTTTVVMRAGGLEGRGEDVTYAAEDHEPYPGDLPLAGRWTLDAFSRRLDDLDLFPARSPQQESFRHYRRWAFESAALDLALRQRGKSLGTVLGRSYRPVRFVVSTRLDIRPWLSVDPALEFKLDPTPEWSADEIRRIATSGAVRVLDLKSFYEGSPVDNPPDPVQYAAVASAFPDAVLEDPSLSGPARRALDGHEQRFSFDAPVRSWSDVVALGPSLRYLNVKPSRFGTVRALLDCVERAAAAGMTLYGGGQFELGVGREQIQALASLFYADGPNDVAPREFHGEARADVPHSPLRPAPQGPGFGFVFLR